MRLLYGRHYESRYRAVAALVPPGATVLDVCCGPAVLFHRHLRAKGVRYTGVDVNERYITALVAAGAQGLVCDVATTPALPPAEIVVMQASLYHFLPDAARVVDTLLTAGTQRVIIAEPVRNLADHHNAFIATAARRFSNAGSGPETPRFTETTLDALFDQYAAKTSDRFFIPGAREKVYVLDPSR